MIEAVNSVLANASLLRGTAEQLSTSGASQTALASAPSLESGGISAPVAPFISPYIEVDNNYNKAVLQIRDSDTGDVLKQFPSKEALEARARQRVLEARAQLQESAAPSKSQGSDFSIGVQGLSGETETTQSSQPSDFVAVQSEFSGGDVSPAPSFGGIPQAQVAAAALAASAQVSQPTSSGTLTTA